MLAWPPVYRLYIGLHLYTGGFFQMATQIGLCGPRKYAGKIDTKTTTYQIGPTDVIQIPANADRLSINFRNNQGNPCVIAPEGTDGIVGDFDRVAVGATNMYKFDDWGPIVSRSWTLYGSGGACVIVATEIYFINT